MMSDALLPPHTRLYFFGMVWTVRQQSPGQNWAGTSWQISRGKWTGHCMFCLLRPTWPVWNPWSHAMLGQENGISRAWVSSIKYKWGDLMWLYSPANSPGRKINRFWGWAAAGGKAGTIRRAALTCEELVLLLWTSANLNEFFITGNLGFSLRIYFSGGAKCRRQIQHWKYKFWVSQLVVQAGEGSSNTTAGHSLCCIRS